MLTAISPEPFVFSSAVYKLNIRIHKIIILSWFCMGAILVSNIKEGT
jgi:hypothetical protein